MNTTPYISIPEVLNAPTGINWETIPRNGATNLEKQAEYLQLTRRGSAWVDTTCKQSLNSTLDIDTVKVGTRRCGWRSGILTVITRFSPLTEIPLIEVSQDGLNWTILQGQVLITGSQAYQCLNPSPTGGWIRTSYIHGFVNTALSADAAALATSLTVDDATGIHAGMDLPIYDGTDFETVTVRGTYTSGLTLPLVSGLVYAHLADTLISALPTEIREAAQLAVIHYARVRGRSAITVQPTGGSRSIVAVNQLEEFTEAKGLLNSYRRVL